MVFPITFCFKDLEWWSTSREYFNFIKVAITFFGSSKRIINSFSVESEMYFPLSKRDDQRVNKYIQNMFPLKFFNPNVLC